MYVACSPWYEWKSDVTSLFHIHGRSSRSHILRFLRLSKSHYNSSYLSWKVCRMSVEKQMHAWVSLHPQMGLEGSPNKPPASWNQAEPLHQWQSTQTATTLLVKVVDVLSSQSYTNCSFSVFGIHGMHCDFQCIRLHLGVEVVNGMCCHTLPKCKHPSQSAPSFLKWCSRV